jgi:glycerol dehydrogenase-like iron-containing ADH family enzyme
VPAACARQSVSRRFHPPPGKRCHPNWQQFNGEASSNEITRLSQLAKNQGCNVVVGLGVRALANQFPDDFIRHQESVVTQFGDVRPQLIQYAFLVADEIVWKLIGERTQQALQKAGVNFNWQQFNSAM